MVLVFEISVPHGTEKGNISLSKGWLMEVEVAIPEHFFPLVSKQEKKDCHFHIEWKNARIKSLKGLPSSKSHCGRLFYFESLYCLNA